MTETTTTTMIISGGPKGGGDRVGGGRPRGRLVYKSRSFPCCKIHQAFDKIGLEAVWNARKPTWRPGFAQTHSGGGGGLTALPQIP